MQSIEWRAVVGYEGLYEVSDQGQVRRIAKARGTRAGRISRAKPSPDGRPIRWIWSGMEDTTTPRRRIALTGTSTTLRTRLSHEQAAESAARVSLSGVRENE